MATRRARLLRTSNVRPVRSAVALLLGATISASGFVALATPAHAGPVPPTISSPVATVTSNDRTPQVVFSGPGAQYECAAVLGSASPGYQDCSSPWNAPLGADGDYTLSVREKSLADDGTPAAVAYTLDTVAQLSVVAPRSPGKDPRPTWTVSTEPSGTVSCALDGDPAVPCAGGFTPSADLAEGPHTLTVTATDPAGNTSPPDSSTYIVDLTAPSAPTVTGSSGTSNDTTPTWTWSAAPGDTALCTLTSPSGTGAESACTSAGSDTETVSDEGDYELSVVVVDAAGNRSPAGTGPTYTLDSTPSAAAVFGTAPTSPSTTPSVTWTFTEPGASSTCRLVGAVQGVLSDQVCSSPATFPLPADDSYTLVVAEHDGSGNSVSATSPASYVLDTAGPAAPAVSAPSGVSNDATPHITWTGEIPSTALCRWERTVGAVVTDGAWVDCGARFFDPVLPGDGSYVFQAQLTDPLGNVGVIGTSAAPYVYDGTAPDAPVLVTPPTPDLDPTPTVTFTPEAPGGTAECAFWSGTTAPATPTWSDCTSGSFTPSLPSDGTWTLAVRLADVAGNVSAPGTFTYDLDTAAPTPVVISGPTGPSNDVNPVFDLASDPGDLVTCQVFQGIPATTQSATGKVTCSTTYSPDLKTVADGDYTVVVTAKDGANNTAVTTWPYTLDTTAPSTPVITGPLGTGNDPDPTWSFAVQTGTKAQCRLVQGVSVSAWSDCSDGSFDVPGIADGTYTVDVVVTDLAGNDAALGSSPVYVSDRTAPADPVVTGPTGPGHDATPTWTWTGEAGTTATCRLDRGGVVGNPAACSGGTFTPTLTGDTSYDVVVQLTDAAGNTSAAVSAGEYDLDTLAPATPTVTGPTGPSQTPAATWTWTAEAGAVSSCVLVHDGVAGAGFSCASGDVVALGTDGSYALQVTVTDAAGNASPPATSAGYVLDRAGPAAPVVTTPPSPASDRSPSFSFTGETGATFECRWLQGSTTVNDWAPCTSPYVGQLGAMPDADYLLEVRSTDVTGNTGATGSSLAYRLDTTAPAAPLVSLPAGPSTDTTPLVTWTGEAGATAVCTVSSSSGSLAPAACASPWSAPLPADGSWTVSVTLTDVAGNTSLPGTAGPYLLDTTPPAAPRLTAPRSPDRDRSPSWSGSVGPQDTAECSLTSPAGPVFGWTPCAFPYATPLGTGPDGTYTLSARAVDEVGLTSAVTSADYVLDTDGPAAPVVTAATPTGSTTSPQFTFTVEAGSTATCAVLAGSTVVRAAASCTSPVTADLTGQADGTYTLSVVATDAAGNAGPAGSATYVLDRQAPAAPVLTLTPASPSPLSTPAFGFTAEAGADTTCTVVGAAAGLVQSGPCTSPFTPSLPADDTYTISVTATDAAGNTGPAVTVTYVLDTSAPAAPVLIPPASPSQSTTPRWGVTAPEGTVQCQLSFGSTTVVDWTDCTSGFVTTISGSDGTYVLSARTIDGAGNASAVATSSYVLDRTAPAAPTFATPASPSNDRQPSWSVTGSEDGLTATCSLEGPPGTSRSVSCTAPTSGAPVVIDLATAPDGSYTLTATVSDAAGNTATATSAAYVLDTTPPSTVLITAPPSPGSRRIVMWTLTGDVDASFECRLLGLPSASASFVPCGSGSPGTGSFTADLTTASDGDYTLQVRTHDSAGNISAVTSSSYTLDTLAPSTPMGLAAGRPSPSNVPTVTWTFSLDADSTALCQLLSSTAVITQEQPCSSPRVTDLTGLPDGTYSLSVRAQDAAGNLSAPTSADYELDRAAPSPPVITKTPGSPSPETDPEWTVSTSDASDVLSCRLVGLAGSDWAPCSTSVAYHLAPATSGSYTLQVRETDAAGNVSPVTSAEPYVLDSNAPFPPVVNPPAASPGNSLRPVFRISPGSGTGADITSMTCTVTRFDGQPASATPCAFGRSTVVLTGVAARAQGPVTLAVQVRDDAGNESGSASATYLYDAVPPAPAQFRPLAADVGTSPRVTWAFGEPAGSSLLRADQRTSDLLATSSVGSASVSFSCQLLLGTGRPDLTKARACRSPHTELLTQAGTWTLWLWAVDAAGNRATPVASRYTFISPVPAVTDLRTPAGGPDSHPSWTFTVPAGYSAVCLLTSPSDAVLATSTCSSGRFTADLSRQPHGAYTIAVQLLNARGDEGPYTRSTPYAFKASASGPSTSGPRTHSTPPTVNPGPRAVVPPAPRPGHLPPLTNGTPVSHVAPPESSHTGTSNGGARAISVPAPGGLITKEATKAIGKTLAQVAQKPTIPLLLLGVVVGFLLLQNRIDRRDPKLASAPVGAEPELDFGPVQGRTGGAPA
ncbi:MAG: hypothetical protein JWO22_3044 [Frankiales bacterium]|nr:hypothetical protein [Frankiales bacterium]